MRERLGIGAACHGGSWLGRILTETWSVPILHTREGDRLSVRLAQRRPPPPSLAQIKARSSIRNDAIATAYATGAYTYREIDEYFGVHLVTVGLPLGPYRLQLPAAICKVGV